MEIWVIPSAAIGIALATLIYAVLSGKRTSVVSHLGLLEARLLKVEKELADAQAVIRNLQRENIELMRQLVQANNRTG